MSDPGENFGDFEATAVAAPDETLIVAVDGFEGPLDLLLTLARNQKVDIAKISILKLADQYLEFIESAKTMNLELAADYLVMAAWLAYLKSRLILPQPPNADGEPTADEMATRLRWRLQRLEAMRQAAARLMGGDRLDRDVFARGDPEPINVIKLRTYKDSLYDLLTAYATQRVKKMGGKTYRPVHAPVLAIEEARERLETNARPDLRTGAGLSGSYRSNGRAASAAARRLRAPCSPAWNWRATARSKSARWRRSKQIFVRDRVAPTAEAVS